MAARKLGLLRGVAAVALCVGAVLVGSASPALAGSLTQLPSTITAPTMVVDPVGQHIFVSGGPDQSVIVVLDFDGTIVKTITGEPGATAMALNPGTHDLYVALNAADAISEIDTQTLTETSRFSVAPLPSPYSVVVAGGELWFSDNNGYGSGYVATMNFDGSGVAQQQLGGIPPALFLSVELASGGANNDILVTAQASGGLSEYDVSSGSAVQVPGPWTPSLPGGGCGSFRDFSVDPLGAGVLFAAYSCAALFSTGSSGTRFMYPSELGPDAVAWSADGQYVAVGVNGAYIHTGVEVFQRGSAQLWRAWAQSGVAPRGLALSPDGTKVFALVGAGGGLGFEVLGRDSPPDTKLTSGPAATTDSTKPSFRFSSTTVDATFQCNLDDAGWQPCTSPANYTGVGPGSHTFDVRGVWNGEVDTVGASETWTVTPPDTKIKNGPSDPTGDTSATFTFYSDASDITTFTCNLDGAGWSACASPTTYTSLALGSHTFQVKATDTEAASDEDPVGASQTWTITAPSEKLTVIDAGAGTGTVTSNPTGIDCGSTCASSYDEGTSVQLTATATAGSAFAGWTGGGCSGLGTCTVSMTQARSVIAAFAPPEILNVTRSGAGVGTVTSSPAGLSCGSTCSHTYPHGTSVTLTASAASGSVFTRWSGACTGPSTTCHLSMTSARTPTATFALTKPLTVLKLGKGSGRITSLPAGVSCTATCTHSFAAGKVVTLTAVAKSGSKFTGWSGACSGTAKCVVTMTVARTVKATFAYIGGAAHRAGSGGPTSRK